MNLDENGIKFLIKHEGKRNKAYKDTKGYWTTGIGHLILKGEEDLIKKVLTEEEIMQIFKKDISIAVNAINKEKLNLNQNQFNALVSFVFNVGVGAFKKSTLLKLLKQNKFLEAGEQFARWENKNRRIDEKKLFLA